MKFVQSSSYSDTVISELRKELKTQATEWFRVLRNDVVVSPTTEDGLKYHKGTLTVFHRPRTWREYLRLLLVHWYLPEEAFALVHLELQEMENKFGTDKAIAAHAILRSEPEMVIYLMESSAVYKTERELFGDIHSQFSFKKYHFKNLDRRKPRKKVFRRGYHDQGSRRLPHEQHEAKFDYSLTEEQNRIEEERQILEDTHQIVGGMLE